MKLSISKLQQILREELESARNESPRKKIDQQMLSKLIRIYDNDPFKTVPVEDLRAAGVPVNSNYTYHVVYGDLVARDEEGDAEYFTRQQTWERTTEKTKHHPTSVHKPSPEPE
jgi:hypothetical protein